MNATILLTTSDLFGMNPAAGYVIGAIMALLLLGFLFYSLFKPEKF